MRALHGVDRERKEEILVLGLREAEEKEEKEKITRPDDRPREASLIGCRPSSRRGP